MRGDGKHGERGGKRKKGKKTNHRAGPGMGGLQREKNERGRERRRKVNG
ncbi:MAG: hypothetical protein RJR35_00480 [Thermoanaerobacterales bacterium]|nr:hypothetical protein [Thermoanaerobacterales bacterium]